MFWHDKRVMVAGGAGFLGRHIVKRLEQLGCREVFVPRSKEYDLTREEAVRKLYSDHPCDLVIDSAGRIGGIGANRKEPGKFFYDNLIMGANLMEHARRAEVAKFVALGTICSYPKFTPVPFQEGALWDGYPEETNAPYGIAKKMLLVQAQTYREQYGFNCVHLLLSNLYGPGSNADPGSSNVIIALIRKCLEAKANGEMEVVCWGTGSPTREFLYVEDAAEAVVLAAEKYNEGSPANVGSGEEISIKGLAEKIAAIADFQGAFRWDPAQPDGQPRRCLDTRIAREKFGFTARTTLDAGIGKTIEWYRSARVAAVGA